MKKLTTESFSVIELPDTNIYYMAHKTADGCEVCLEPCLYGYCVGIYDDTQNIIGEKTCTKFKSWSLGPEALYAAIDIANKKLNYEQTN